MKCIALITAAVLAASPVHANTWVTYATAYVSGSDFPPNNGSWLRQLDVKSVARHAGWTHANTRFCKEDEARCRPTNVVSVHCGKALYKDSIIESETRRVNGNEWWFENEIRKGTRGNTNRNFSDQRKSEIFNVLCSH